MLRPGFGFPNGTTDNEQSTYWFLVYPGISSSWHEHDFCKRHFIVLGGFKKGKKVCYINSVCKFGVWLFQLVQLVKRPERWFLPKSWFASTQSGNALAILKSDWKEHSFNFWRTRHILQWTKLSFNLCKLRDQVFWNYVISW